MSTFRELEERNTELEKNGLVEEETLNGFPVRKLLYLSRHKMVAWTRVVVKVMGR